MTTKRIKATSLESATDFSIAVDNIAHLAVRIRQTEAVRDQKIQAIRELFDSDVKALADRRDALMLAAEKYADEHRDEILPSKAKSSETALSVYGFRLGQPTLKLLNRSWSWEKVLQGLKAANLSKYIRNKPEVDKEAIKTHLTAEQQAAVGVRVDQVETFFVEAKDQPSEGDPSK